MNKIQILNIAAAACSTFGSILTAISLNRSLNELNLARKFMDVTIESFVLNSQIKPIFKGLDERYEKASFWSNFVVWLGVIFLVIGLALSIYANLNFN